MTHPVIPPFLQHIQTLCPSLADEDLAFFARGLSVIELSPKAMLYQAGDKVHHLHYVAQGLIKAFYVGEQGNQININFLREGVYAVDYLAFSTKTPSKYSFQCLEYCVLIAFSAQHQEHCSKHIPHIERYFRIMIEQAFIRYLQRTEGFLLSSAESRYRQFISQNPELFRRLSVSDLCSYLGIQRQHLTRIHKKLLQE